MLSTSSSLSSPSWGTSHATIAKMVADRAGRDWCLFLDRDGVLNRQIVGDYVRSWPQFQWLPGAFAALEQLSDWAPHIVVVTNQQGIGKKLMTADQVSSIHARIAGELALSRVTIDEFRVCPHLDIASCRCRKPAPGMVLDWLRVHPDVDPTLSLVVGDSPSDIAMARNVAAATGGCSSVQIGTQKPSARADATFESLWDLATAVGHTREGHD
jgi:histidinol-phosphate phosphatase family protein